MNPVFKVISSAEREVRGFLYKGEDHVRTFMYGGKTGHNTEAARKTAAVIRPLSFRALNFLNGNDTLRRVLNSNNTKIGYLDNVGGKVLRAVARLFVGLAFALFAGVVGVLYHFIAFIGCALSAPVEKMRNVKSKDWVRAKEHLKAAVRDCFAPVHAVRYAVKPEAYFGAGEQHRFDIIYRNTDVIIK